MIYAITQRHDKNKHGDWVDSLENNYMNYFGNFGKLVPVPNVGKEMDFDGLILTGGNSVIGEGASEQRNKTETRLIRHCMDNNKPILGICRGMQMVNHYFGGQVIAVKDHVAVDHEVEIEIGEQKVKTKVNSFHNMGFTKKELSPKLKAFAYAGDVIEGVFHPNYPIAGILWHPERKSPDTRINLRLITAYFGKKLFWR